MHAEQAAADSPRTLFDKVWQQHEILRWPQGPSLLYVDRDFVHEGAFHAFGDLKRRGLQVRCPERVVGFADHYVPTKARDIAGAATPAIAKVLQQFSDNARWSGIRAFDIGDERQGIVHVAAPELGLTQPGMVITCNDSHTSTHGALGAIAFGIGQSETTQVLATQTVWLKRPSLMRINVTGSRASGVSAKDVMLAILAQVGSAGAVGHAIEYAGSVVAAMSIEERLTLCNMSIELGGRCGMVAPDDTTFAYLFGRPFAPDGQYWDAAVAYWRTLGSDPDAVFDKEIQIDGSAIAPMVTWGTSPDAALPIDARVPDPERLSGAERATAHAALEYMGLQPNTPLTDIAIDRVFIGSCTNSRIEDLRAAAAVAAGRKAVVPAIVVPGSESVRRAAEAEGLDQVFLAAGFEWRHAGCSMCVAMNGDVVAPGERCASTSNRNFMGRQGPNARTHLMSPAMAAAAAVTGRLSDVRRLPTRKRA
ncbi:3-isopropylmalate dehydratase large subunit [Peristeroidobacter soli]|jgi:3-isopropylmalate/(R)-2-methylmalate dehydratase large subunit|uniref:3-isopropylmalate dehydratase large subunit n=1 Tax=Peristeroidobacter soli TaxID=2497877 RepID=UPI00101C67F1|nr:3-isopropylmalate dehydratase large subunit [Peristeroidobacter soli]